MQEQLTMVALRRIMVLQQQVGLMLMARKSMLDEMLYMEETVYKMFIA